MKTLLYVLIVIVATETYFLYSMRKENAVAYKALQAATESQSNTLDNEVLAYSVYVNMLTNLAEELNKTPNNADKMSKDYICRVLPLGEEYIKNKRIKAEKSEDLVVLLERNKIRCGKL